MTARQWERLCAICHAAAVGLYTDGWRCAAHTPAAIAGRPETVPDPALTLAGIRAARGVRYSPPPTETVVDRAAIASGKRRSSTRAYRDAQRST